LRQDAKTPWLYVIVDRGVCASDDAWLRTLDAVAATEGCPELALQVRIKGCEVAERMRLLEAAAKTLRGRRVPALLNGSTVEAVNAGFDGVHWPETAIPLESEAWRPRRFVVGASVHSLTGLRRAEAAGAAFAVFAPVFEPGSKRAEPAGVVELQKITKAASVPVLALGGVTPERVETCVRSGAAGVAAVSGIVLAANPTHVIAAYAVHLRRTAVA
jgi:thiamine-phosphate diphosphorylase